MAFQVTRSHLVDAQDKLNRARAQVATIREKSAEAIGTIVQTFEVGGTAFGVGFMQGRWGSIELAGVPVEFIAGLGLHVLAFLGGAGRYAEHVHNVGDGALAGYATKLGQGFGDKMKVGGVGGGVGAMGQGFSYTGALGQGSSRPLSDAELAALVNAAK